MYVIIVSIIAKTICRHKSFYMQDISDLSGWDKIQLDNTIELVSIDCESQYFIRRIWEEIIVE